MSKISIFLFKLAEIYAKLPPTISFLDAVDITKFTKISAEKRRQEFLVARYVTKTILKDLYKVKTPTFTYNSKGKPKIKGLKFNWTHSENQGVLVIAQDLELGVDIEITTKSKAIDKISKTFFSQDEYRYIFSAKSEKQQRLRFQKLWSLKEAFVKAWGKKLTKKTIKIYFNLPQNTVTELPTKKVVSFFLHEKKPLSVCAIGQVKKLDIYAVHMAGKTLKVSTQKAQKFIKLY
jgi:phosphopantetheine--protein transferase-like protein